jgi:hypothetical protein
VYGLTVRWSLTDSDPATAGRLREYVTNSSLDRFTGMPGLMFKTWRMRPQEWFEGTYVWTGADSRQAFAEAFAAGADTSPVSSIVGAGPALMEPWEVVAVAEGGDGFRAGSGSGE